MQNKKQTECAAKKTSIGGQAVIEGVMMRGPFKIAPRCASPTAKLSWTSKI